MSDYVLSAEIRLKTREKVGLWPNIFDPKKTDEQRAKMDLRGIIFQSHDSLVYSYF